MGARLTLARIAFSFGLLGACAPSPAPFALSLAQPSNRPVRNLTSLDGALQCMDRLLAEAGRPRTLVTSSEIKDSTGLVRIGADDMLINAVNQLNRTSQSYVFLDQARVSDSGQLDLVTRRPKGELVPDIYIRGSISQLDGDTESLSGTAGWARTGGTGSRLTTVNAGPSRSLSVVTVDLHLVDYPSRTVIPGASVANSMVFVRNGFTGLTAGLVDIAGLNLSLRIDRVESKGQAVRNLIELGAIELLGRHAGVPYWKCLAREDTDGARRRREARAFLTETDAEQVREAETLLTALGLSEAEPDGALDPAERAIIQSIQREEGLVPDGTVNFDLVRRLRLRLEARKRAAAGAASVRPADPGANTTRPASCGDNTPATGPACTGGFVPLYDYLHGRRAP